MQSEKLSESELDELERGYHENGYHWIGNGLMLRLVATCREALAARKPVAEHIPDNLEMISEAWAPPPPSREE